MTNYPATIDNSITLPVAIDNATPVQASVVNALRSAIVAVETALGTSPAGPYGNVGARITNLENIVNNQVVDQFVELAGDLGNTVENPFVIGIWGRPVSSAAPSLNNTLVWSGIAWIPGPGTPGPPGPQGPPGSLGPAGGDLSGVYPNPLVVGLQGRAVSSIAPTDGYILTWVAAHTDWEPKSPPISFTPGGDLSGTNTFQTVIGIQGNPIQPGILGSGQDGYVLTWINGDGEWEAKPPSSILTIGVVYSFSNTSSDIGTYDNLLISGTGVQSDQSVSITSGSGLTLIQSFATQFNSPNVSLIPAGRWDFDHYSYVNNASSISQLVFQVYTRTAGGAETLLFSVVGPDIATTTVSPATVSFDYPNDTVIPSTDRIVVKVLAQTNSSSSKTIHFVFDGSVNASHVHTPLAGVAVQLGGDLSGTTNSATVIKINGASVPVSGALTTGNVLQVNGTASLTYGPVNLAGGTNFITGALPLGNLTFGTAGQFLLTNAAANTAVWTSLSGDVTSSVSTVGQTTVGAIQGNTVTAGALTKGQFFVASSASNWAATTLSGDISESAVTAGLLTVVAISGSSPIPITPSVLQWTTATATPTLNQATTGGASGQTLTIQAQNAATTGGNLALTSGTGATAGNVSLQTGGSTRLTANATGVITIPNLGGSGTGYVATDNSGNLSWSRNAISGTNVKLPFLAGVYATNQTAFFVIVGSAELDITTLQAGTKTIKLQVLLETTGPVASVRLYNFTSASVVTGSTLSTSSTSASLLTSGDLTAALTNGSAVYQVQVEMAAGGGAGDQITCTMARLIVTYT